MAISLPENTSGKTAVVTAVALISSLFACRTSQVAHAVDPDAASCIPAGAIVIAGVDLTGLRASPFHSKLPAAAIAIAGSLTTASSALLAYNGKELLVIARGHFAQVPPGAELVAAGLAVFGSPQLVAAALAQHRSHATGAPALVEIAEPIAAGSQIWVVAQGGVPLPLTGNAENLNHVMRNAESVTVSASIASGLALAVTALGRTEDSARNIEETLRADITLAAAAEARKPDLAKLLRSIRIDRDGRTVRIALSADADAAAKLISAFAP